MTHKILNKTQIPNKAEGVSSITAEIDGVRYNSITPKFILNKDIFDNTNNIKYKTKEYILPGINAIDIDWNGAEIGNKDISTTSDLLTLLANMYLDIKKTDNAEYLWEDVVMIDPSYQLFYEDSENKKISNYTPITLYTINQYNIAPYTADHLGVYDEHGNRIYGLPLDSCYAKLKHNFGVRFYRVGLMSDIHHDDICDLPIDDSGNVATDVLSDNGHNETDSGNSFNPYEDLDHVLEHYSIGGPAISFICCAGDISTDNINHVKAYASHVQKSGHCIPIYTCKGNHDNAACAAHDGETGNNLLWNLFTMPLNSKEKIVYFSSGDKTSFYFDRDGDVYIFFNVNYNLTGSTGYKGLTREDYDYDNINGQDYGSSTRCYHPDTIKELQKILDENRNKRCFVFTHQPFVNKAGNVNYSYTKNRSTAYVLNGIQFAILNEINNYYKNSIWFSGHTHYQWKWHTLSNRANVCNWDVLNDDYNFNDFDDYGKNINNKYTEQYDPSFKKSAYNVHIPSTSRPLRPESQFPGVGYNNLIADPGCEGAIMDVYSTGVNIRGIQFADEYTETETKTVMHGGKRLLTAQDIYIDISKDGYTEGGQTIEQLDNGYIKLKFGEQNTITNKCDQRFIIQNYGGNYIELEDIKITNADGVDVTDTLKSLSNPKIGIFGKDKKYHLSSTEANYIDNATNVDAGVLAGLEFPLSSSFLNDINIYKIAIANSPGKHYDWSAVTLPLYITFKAYTLSSNDVIVEKTIKYEDKYVSDANYWLPVPKVSPVNIESKDYDYFEKYVQKFNR